MDAIRVNYSDPFSRAIRTVGPVEITKLCAIETPPGFESWDICQACEFLQLPRNHAKILMALAAGAVSEARIEILDDVLSSGTAPRLRTFLSE